MDILSLVPLDLLYFKFGVKAVYLRAPRLLKIQSFWELFRLLDRVIASPYLVSHLISDCFSLSKFCLFLIEIDSSKFFFFLWNRCVLEEH